MTESGYGFYRLAEAKQQSMHIHAMNGVMYNSANIERLLSKQRMFV